MATTDHLSYDAIQRYQALGVTPREDGESWAAYLARVEATREWSENGTYTEPAQ